MTKSGGKFSYFIVLVGIHHTKLNQEFLCFEKNEMPTNFEPPAIREIRGFNKFN